MARGLFIIREARITYVEVPKSAPIINGIAFFKVINLETANGTSNPIVIDEEKTTAVRMTPKRYALYFLSKKLFIFFLVFSSPPKTLMIDLLMNLMEKISITKEKNKITKRLLCEIKKFVIGDVKNPTMFGK